MPPDAAQALRLTLEDLVLEEAFFGKAFDKYAAPGQSTARAALLIRVGLLMDAAVETLLALLHAGGDGSALSPRDAARSLTAFEEWAPVWPLLGALDARLRAAGLAGLALKGKPLDIASLMAPLVTQWIIHLTVRFDDELEAAWQSETWSPLHPLATCEEDEDGGRGPTGYSAIVWDLMKLFMSTLEVFFGEFEREARHAETRPAPLRAEWVRELAFKVFLSLNRFVNRMRQNLGSWRALIHALARPTQPELEPNGGAAVNQLAEDSLRFLGETQKLFGAVWDAATDGNGSKQDKTASAADAARAELRMLCVQLNSLLFCRDELRGLARYLALPCPPPSSATLVQRASPRRSERSPRRSDRVGEQLACRPSLYRALSPRGPKLSRRYLDQQWTRLHAWGLGAAGGRATRTSADGVDVGRAEDALADLPPPPETVLHAEAICAVDAAIDEVCGFIGAHMVLVHFRQPLLTSLYSRDAPSEAALAPSPRRAHIALFPGLALAWPCLTRPHP